MSETTIKLAVFKGKKEDWRSRSKRHMATSQEVKESGETDLATKEEESKHKHPKGWKFKKKPEQGKAAIVYL